MTSRRLRILFLASYFPKPDNPLMGTWALTQAQAIARQDVELLVASFTSWVPKVLARTGGAKAYADCPNEFIWQGGVRVRYPRWLYYPVPPIKSWMYTHPEPYLKMAWWSAQQSFLRLMEAFQPDVIFCHHALPNGWMLTQLPPTLQKPLITLDHDFDEIADCYHLPFRKVAVQSVADQSWAMLAVSNRMKNDLNQLFPKTRIQTLHNGVDPLPDRLFHQCRPSELEGKKVILCCALFAERKGIPILVRAFHQISSQHPDAVLRIVGSGPDETVIQAAIAELNLSNQVQMVGRKPHAEVLQEMVWADCFALVGWDEPFATVYLEAMAAGKPVICCSDGGITDVLQDGVHGYTVPPKSVEATADALDRMLSNEAQRTQMGQNAQRLIEQHLTWDVKAKELIQLMETAVNSPRQLNLTSARQ
jgi:glycosyltransferase involved in cell wall biosynthesis